MADAVAMIVISAGVAATVSSVALALNGWRERLSRVSLQQMQDSHQATIRDLDRRHEAHLRDLDRNGTWTDGKRSQYAIWIGSMRAASTSSLICGRSET